MLLFRILVFWRNVLYMKNMVKIGKINNKLEILLIIFFIYNEIILKIASKSNFSIKFFIFIITISISISFLISFVIKNIKNKNISFNALLFILIFTSIIFMSELNTKSTFGNYYDFSYMLVMSKSVFSNFLNMVFSSLYINIFYLILMIIPITLYLYFKRTIMRILKSEKFLKRYKVRARIEPKNAEMKRFHGLDRANGYGLKSVLLQAMFTAIAVNLKRAVMING